jgi:hypothetical protein
MAPINPPRQDADTSKTRRCLEQASLSPAFISLFNPTLPPGLHVEGTLLGKTTCRGSLCTHYASRLTHPSNCTVEARRRCIACRALCTSQTSMPGLSYLRRGGRKDGTRGCCLDCRCSISHCDSALVFSYMILGSPG